MRTNLEDKCNLNDALYQSLMVMRMTIPSKTKETPFERHYDRKPRTELTSYLDLPTDKKNLFQHNWRSYKSTRLTTDEEDMTNSS